MKAQDFEDARELVYAAIGAYEAEDYSTYNMFESRFDNYFGYRVIGRSAEEQSILDEISDEINDDFNEEFDLKKISDLLSDLYSVVKDYKED